MEQQRALMHFGIPGMKWGTRRGRQEHKALKKQIKKQAQDTKMQERKKKAEESDAAESARLKKKLYDQTPEGKAKKQEARAQSFVKAMEATSKALDYIGSDEVKIYNKIYESDPKLAKRYIEEQKKFNPNAYKMR